MVRFLIAYASMSGNTEEVAFIIGRELESFGHEVKYCEMGFGRVPYDYPFDVLLVGSYTWHEASTPDEAKDFVRDLGYRPSKVAIFGTGDTQFGGDELFCRAAEKLARYYNATYPVLKIEQSPGDLQKPRIIEWAKGVVEHW